MAHSYPTSQAQTQQSQENVEPQPQPQVPEEPSSSLDPPAQIDLAITLILNSWPALTLAVQSSWGGEDAGEKRDWLCGAVSDLFSSRPDTDAEDLEEILLQVMSDEFDVVVEDESAAEIAGSICQTRKEVMSGEYGTVRSLWEQWKSKGKSKGKDLFKKVETNEEDQETESEEDDSDEDVEMEDARPRPPREKTEPEVDEEGFTKVVGKNKR